MIVVAWQVPYLLKDVVCIHEVELVDVELRHQLVSGVREQICVEISRAALAHGYL
jgi:hypothetical protein